jgi:hypothetical protein
MEEKTNIPTEAVVKGDQSVESQKPAHDVPYEDKVSVKRGRVDSIVIFEVTENELNIIRNGSETSIYLNFSIFLITVALSFLISLLTADFSKKLLVFTIFCTITTCAFLIGIFLFFLWLKKKDRFKEVILKIQNRIKE